MNELCLSGRFRWELWSAPVTAHPPWGAMPGFRQLLDSGEMPNSIVTATENNLLDTYFSNGTPAAAWYLGLIDNENFSALSPNDSMSSHAGWQELTDYSESTRPAWAPGSAAGGIKTNAEAVVFTASSDFTAKGLFVTSDDTKGGTSGVLWSSATFGVEKQIAVGQTLRVFYETRARQG